MPPRYSAAAVLLLLIVTVALPLAAADATAAAPASIDAVAASPWAAAHGTDAYGTWADLRLNDVTQRFRLILPGTFMMGSPPDEMGRSKNETQHAVTIAHAYWLADSPCTQALWFNVTGGKPSVSAWEAIGSGPTPAPYEAQVPVQHVSWNQCQQMLAQLSCRLIGPPACLPTDAEWEYACRAGTTGPIPGPNLDAVAWYTDNSGQIQHPVKQKAANAWGLYDMLGNICQWCGDGYTIDPQGAFTDPATVPNRVYRGMSYGQWPREGRSAHRDRLNPDGSRCWLGLRICIPVTADADHP